MAADAVLLDVVAATDAAVAVVVVVATGAALLVVAAAGPAVLVAVAAADAAVDVVPACDATGAWPQAATRILLAAVALSTIRCRRLSTETLGIAMVQTPSLVTWGRIRLRTRELGAVSERGQGGDGGPRRHPAILSHHGVSARRTAFPNASALRR
jgi:hypothetical protein